MDVLFTLTKCVTTTHEAALQQCCTVTLPELQSDQMYGSQHVTIANSAVRAVQVYVIDHI